MLDCSNSYGDIPEHPDYLEDDPEKSEQDDVRDNSVSVVPIILCELEFTFYLYIKIKNLQMLHPAPNSFPSKSHN